MFICSCNALTDRDIASAIASGASRPSEIHAACGVRAQCGNCVPSVLCLLRQALAASFQIPAAHAHGAAASL